MWQWNLLGRESCNPLTLCTDKQYEETAPETTEGSGGTCSGSDSSCSSKTTQQSCEQRKWVGINSKQDDWCSKNLKYRTKNKTFFEGLCKPGELLCNWIPTTINTSDRTCADIPECDSGTFWNDETKACESCTACFPNETCGQKGYRDLTTAGKESGVCELSDEECPETPCPKNCEGKWEVVMRTKESETARYKVTQQEDEGGEACPYADGTEKSETCKDGFCTHCDATWEDGACSKSCGGGELTSTRKITKRYDDKTFPLLTPVCMANGDNSWDIRDCKECQDGCGNNTNRQCRNCLNKENAEFFLLSLETIKKSAKEHGSTEHAS